MALVTPNAAEVKLLDTMLKEALDTDQSLSLKLFKNDYTPIAGTVASDFTEADFTDYAAKTLARASWGAATTVSGKASSTYGSAQTWTCGSTGNTVYGYYVVGGTDGVIRWAERFSSSRVLASTDILSIQPVFTLNSEN